ncbi:MAG: lipid II flippase Amj family protein [Candidatus Eremiobacteraeota bacterium]|nr:lipid II flippase Amj family protein [Candidatus Eremiobacteraeota bacterium]
MGRGSASLSTYLIVAALLYMCAQALQMGTGAARLAGVRTQRVATGLTLFNLFATTGRLLSLVYQPLIATLADHARAVRGGGAGFEHDMRLLMLAATLGAIIGGALIPTAALVLQRGIGSFERSGSLVRAMSRLGRPSVIGSVIAEFRMPRPAMLTLSARALPKGFLIWNMIVLAFWVTGPLAALDAGVLSPQAAVTAVSLSGLITGVATITLTLIVDPTAALITDQAAIGVRPEQDVKAMLLYLVLTAVIGTLLSQLLLHPAAALIAAVARFLYGGPFHHV